jgi:long-chain acyl-CoA synthetase
MKAPQMAEFTLKALIERSAVLFSSRPSVAFAGESPINYGDLYLEVRQLSRFLQSLGMRHGDHIAVLGENSPNWDIAYFAVTSIGAVIVPIHPDFHASEISHILRHSESRVLFVSERSLYKVDDLHLEELETVIRLDDFSSIRPEGSGPGIHRLGKAEGNAQEQDGRALPEVAPNDAAAVIYTSGTTGHSKGVLLTHRNIVSNAVACSMIQEVVPGDRFLSILPLSHVFECTVGLILPLLHGASIHYLRKPPTAAVLLPSLSAVRPTMMLAVPLIIEKIYKTRVLPAIHRRFVTRQLARFPALRRRLHRSAGRRLMKLFGGELRFFGIGGAPLSPVVEQFLLEAGFPYAIGYGLTETSPLIAGCLPGSTRLRSAGPAVPGVEIRIANPDPASGIGEIEVKSDSVMKEYYKDPERTAESFASDGWFKTGDLGRLDRDAYLYITGRLKNMILGPNGENIYPEAIESVINRSDLVLETLVYQDGGRLVARVHFDYEKLDVQFTAQGLSEFQARARIQQLLEEVKHSANEQVAAFCRISRVIEQLEPFEKTPTQKIKRHLYVAQAVEV